MVKDFITWFLEDIPKQPPKDLWRRGTRFTVAMKYDEENEERWYEFKFSKPKLELYFSLDVSPEYELNIREEMLICKPSDREFIKNKLGKYNSIVKDYYRNIFGPPGVKVHLYLMESKNFEHQAKLSI